MITRISALVGAIVVAGVCISQAESPTPAESPSPSKTPAKRAIKKAKATPAAAAHPTPAPSPSPAKFNLGDLFKPRTSAVAASPAAGHGATMKPANSPAPGGGHGKVWVNTETHVYHKEGSRSYGTTKKGKYMTEAEAIKEGNKAGHN